MDELKTGVATSITSSRYHLKKMISQLDAEDDLGWIVKSASGTCKMALGYVTPHILSKSFLIFILVLLSISSFLGPILQTFLYSKSFRIRRHSPLHTTLDNLATLQSYSATLLATIFFARFLQNASYTSPLDHAFHRLLAEFLLLSVVITWLSRKHILRGDRSNWEKVHLRVMIGAFTIIGFVKHLNDGIVQDGAFERLIKACFSAGSYNAFPHPLHLAKYVLSIKSALNGIPRNWRLFSYLFLLVVEYSGLWNVSSRVLGGIYISVYFTYVVLVTISWDMWILRKYMLAMGEEGLMGVEAFSGLRSPAKGMRVMGRVYWLLVWGSFAIVLGGVVWNLVVFGYEKARTRGPQAGRVMEAIGFVREGEEWDMGGPDGPILGSGSSSPVARPMKEKEAVLEEVIFDSSEEE